jgi:hypothetical protein
MGWLPMLESMPFILTPATDRKETCQRRRCDATTTALGGELPDSGSCIVRNHAGLKKENHSCLELQGNVVRMPNGKVGDTHSLP